MPDISQIILLSLFGQVRIYAVVAEDIEGKHSDNARSIANKMFSKEELFMRKGGLDETTLMKPGRPAAFDGTTLRSLGPLSHSGLSLCAMSHTAHQLHFCKRATLAHHKYGLQFRADAKLRSTTTQTDAVLEDMPLGWSAFRGQKADDWVQGAKKFARGVFRQDPEPGTLILVRAGESQWNDNSTFTGWVDVDLSLQGVQEIEQASRMLLKRGYTIDLAFTSSLKRAIRSTWIILKSLNQIYRPIFKSWRLNERMYGALEGGSMVDAVAQHGEEQVVKWDREMNERPPMQTPDHPFWHGNERKYAKLPKVPQTESMTDTMDRTFPLWSQCIEQALNDGQNVLVVAHGNSLLGLVKHIDNLSDEEIKQVGIPNGIPLIYNFERGTSKRKDVLRPLLQEGAQSPMTGVFLEKKGFWRRNVKSSVPEVRKVAIEGGNQEINTPSSKDGTRGSLAGRQLVIIRHGKTQHNKLGLFTGWYDAPLARQGRQEASNAGKLLRKHGIVLDVVFSSWLSRAIETAWLVLDEVDMLWLPMIKTWRLNERMYGALTGLSKVMIKERYGDAQFKAWRRGYDIRPPFLNSFSSNYPGNDERYERYVKDIRYSFKESILRSLSVGRIELHRKFPMSESLKDCMDRTIPYLVSDIMPQFLEGNKSVLVASSENAIRGMLMYLLGIPEDRIAEVEIPTGLPLIYDLEGKRIRLLDDGKDTDILTKYDFGSSPDLLFKPCYEEDADECVIVGGRSFSYDPLIRLPEA
eukprot:gnl/MRDRNA2_/MRDRNA2_151339_c0_seq1.p1 gnl/MRDRNA2_/MRDRNA2_151339_c0~~gnl/MRDRNA2_/MRDRNA2_151339_c0_seq1.p1  ORF type:complete len:750 (+),score=112.91 gnl/MRDRNA2_/MRDRNA2_151339_c0_seq1:149-2398(+)